MAQSFQMGMNDPAGPQFSPKIFDLFDAWAVYAQDGNHDHDHAHACAGGADDDFHRRRVAAARASIYRGQQIFNTVQFTISGVSGLNDANVLGPNVTGTCGTCHNVPNVGGHSVIRMFDIGTADQINCGPMLPLVTIRQKADPTQIRSVCDLGRANGSHTWAQVGTFRAPPLRGLAAGAPYFHDGQAPTIGSVVDYHNNRFQIGLSAGQKRDLVAFLSAL
jgi:cytochrome c peroxidase